MIVSIPPVVGLYPVTAVGSPLNEPATVFVVAVPLAAVVTTVAHVPEVIAPVPSADVPAAIEPWRAEKLSVIAPGVTLEAVLLHTLKLAVVVVGYAMIVSIPLVLGEYPVTPVGSALNVHASVSVLAIPVCVLVTTVAQVPDVIALVPRETDPLKPDPPLPLPHAAPASERLLPLVSANWTQCPVVVALDGPRASGAIVSLLNEHLIS